jgi:hypothetical protein
VRQTDGQRERDRHPASQRGRQIDFQRQTYRHNITASHLRLLRVLREKKEKKYICDRLIVNVKR